MKKFGEFICKHKIAILIIAVLLCIPSIYGMMATRVNYDILSYLPSNIETVKGEKILSNDFGMGSFSIVLVKDIPQKNLINLENKFREIDSVKDVMGITDVTGSQIPVDMLPDDVLSEIYKEDGTTAVLVTFEDGIAEDRTLDAIQTLRDITDENCKISGMSATNLDIKDICNSEVIIYVIIAVILCAIILGVALDSYAMPFILLGIIGISVLYNMGTNVVFHEISYITKAISALSLLLSVSF